MSSEKQIQVLLTVNEKECSTRDSERLNIKELNNYQHMKENDDKEGEEWIGTAVKEVGTPGKHDNGVVGQGYYCNH